MEMDWMPRGQRSVGSCLVDHPSRLSRVGVVAYQRLRGLNMTVLDRVKALIERLSPDPICDDCIAERLGLTVRQHANHKTRELAGTGGFERRLAPCAICGEPKKVIRHIPG
jgi:hypothetical protein